MCLGILWLLVCMTRAAAGPATVTNVILGAPWASMYCNYVSTALSKWTIDAQVRHLLLLSSWGTGVYPTWL